MDPSSFITDRLKAIDASGIRKVFDLAAKLKDPVNLSIGQPDFDVPQALKEAAVAAIRQGFNRYTVTQGTQPLRDKVAGLIRSEFANWKDAPFATLITSGVSGGLMLALLCCVQPGDEVLIPDPYFVMYKHLVTLAGGTAVLVDTYPDFQLTPQRLARHITPRTKMLLFNSPANPTGVVATDQVCREVARLCEDKNILLLSDEIYDEFCYQKTDRRGTPPRDRCPSPAQYSTNLLLLRGYSKTYAMTGWRLGYVVGPAAIVDAMTKLQQYSFVCAPSMAQVAGVLAHDTDMTEFIEAYRRKRNRVIEHLSGTFDLVAPGGAFYAFPAVPQRLGMSGSQFCTRAVEKGLLIIPGNVFSSRDTHFRISYACDDQMLDRGLDMLLDLAR